MRVAIHQPQYLPYAGFFHKLSLADVFVIMDDVQYDKRFTNRNKIIVPNGWTWITVPIDKECKFGPNLDVKINNKIAWKDLHWKRMIHSYSGAKFFHMYRDYFESLYKKEWDLLFDLDYETTKQVIAWLGIKIEIVRGSELGVRGESTQRLVNTCKALGADTYISGPHGKNYLDEKLFEKSGIRLEYQDYAGLKYQQHLSESFVPDLSIVDLLANVGPSSMRLLANPGVEMMVS